jgi:hypothetical protein
MVSRCQQVTVIHSIAAMLVAGCPVARATSWDDVPFTVASSLPPAVWDALDKGAKDYRVSDHLNPYYLQGDFDGDGRRDTAVLIKHRTTGEVGAAIVFKAGKVHILGAGQDMGEDENDLDWIDAWYVEPKGRVLQGATDEPPPKLRGDAIMVIKTESASRLIYWDGKGFRWYQQGD